MPSLLKRQPELDEEQEAEQKQSEYARMVRIIQQRISKAEVGHWHTLLADYAVEAVQRQTEGLLGTMDPEAEGAWER